MSQARAVNSAVEDLGHRAGSQAEALGEARGPGQAIAEQARLRNHIDWDERITPAGA